jgi:hypothetical protein
MLSVCFSLSLNWHAQAAEAKLAEANKLIDDSVMMATKHKQENRALQDEVCDSATSAAVLHMYTGGLLAEHRTPCLQVARLKQQLEDASEWGAGAAGVGAATAVATATRSAADEEEIGELTDRVRELEVRAGLTAARMCGTKGCCALTSCMRAPAGRGQAAGEAGEGGRWGKQASRSSRVPARRVRRESPSAEATN